MSYISFTVPGKPPAKNARHDLVRRGGHCARKNSDEYNEFVERMREAVEEHEGVEDKGLWRCEIEAYWPEESHVIGHGTANADPDAPISCVLDALQACDVIDDDMRICKVTASKHYDKKSPRVVIRLERMQ